MWRASLSDRVEFDSVFLTRAQPVFRNADPFFHDNDILNTNKTERAGDLQRKERGIKVKEYDKTERRGKKRRKGEFIEQSEKQRDRQAGRQRDIHGEASIETGWK